MTDPKCPECGGQGPFKIEEMSITPHDAFETTIYCKACDSTFKVITPPTSQYTHQAS